MMGLARRISNHGSRSGILNPADAEAVRNGRMGMYWTGYHIALEELVAVQTTLLLQNIDVNPDM